MSNINESIIEDAALTWFGELGYAVRHGPQIAPGEAAAVKRDSLGEVVQARFARAAIRRLNPAMSNHIHGVVLIHAQSAAPHTAPEQGEK